MPLWIRWLWSRQVRGAHEASRQVRRLAWAQRDLLSAESLRRLDTAVREVRAVVSASGKRQEITEAVDRLRRTADQHLRPYPHARWREQVEVLLVTAAVVLALRTFFFQPMAIPSGSAQPTLWGITQEHLVGRPEVDIPGGLRRFAGSWWSGVHYYHQEARASGALRISQPRLVFPFIRMQVLRVGRETHRLFYASSLEDLAQRAGLRDGQSVQAGQALIRLRVTSGDHLFVNRLIYNFRPPQRGETIVFHTHEIERRLRPHPGFPPLIPDTHYIKRLVGLGGDRVRLGDDRHLVINGRRLDASTPGFENVYGFDPAVAPRDSVFSGHVNERVGRLFDRGNLAPCFGDGQTEFIVRPNHFLCFGDNTMNSYDGRAWGDFPREFVVGRASFVFWPITSRFGWGYR